MDKLLKDAIADAKAVRETALANARIALEEAFAPKLQSMLSARINEEEDEEKEEEMDETFEAKKSEEDEEEPAEEEVDEAKKSEEDEEEPAEDDEESTDENLDLDSIIRELEMEAKGEDEEKDEEPAEEVDETKKAEDDEEIDLQELLASLAETDDKDEDDDEVKEGKKKEDEEDMVSEINRLQTELSETRNVVVFLKDKINEINLLNAKLLYTNKLFKKYSLTEGQKVKILESLDRTKTVREVKLIYSTLAESLSDATTTSKKKITESVGAASKKAVGTKKPIIEDSDSLATRFQYLANIKRK